MFSKPDTRVFLAVTSGCVAIVSLFVVLLLVNAQAESDSVAVLAWTIPLLSGVLTGAIAWMLIGDGSVTDADGGRSERATTCAHCGRDILREWKLCPYCGQLLECEVRINPRHTVS